MKPITLSIVVPFHKGLDYLERCLSAVTPLRDGWELVVAADAAVDDCHGVAERYGARVLELPGPGGPAVARNRAAEAALGEILVFIDADVVASRRTLSRVAHIFAKHQSIAAVFGAYDDDPGDPGFVSQYKNLAHSYIHRSSAEVAQTFWAGFGAVRRDVFLSIGGFDERFVRPSVEDIDLGYRLTAAGFRVLLDPSLRVCHLKRWTLGKMIASDIRDRGIPWTQLILRSGRFNNDLNLKSSYRACVLFAYLALFLLPFAWHEPLLLVPIALLVATVVFLSRRYYRFFYRRRGAWFALRVFPLHYAYHLYNGLSFTIGTLLFLAARAGVTLPGALPTGIWGALDTVPDSSVPSDALASSRAQSVLTRRPHQRPRRNAMEV